MNFAAVGVVSLYRFLRFSCKDLVMPYYAVVKGRTTGVLDTWDKCRASTQGFPSAKFKSFKTKEEAIQFCRDNRVSFTQDNIGLRGDKYNDVIEIMDSDEGDVPACKPSAPLPATIGPAVHQTSSELKIFDFASFSQRLTSLEDTYKKKIRELEDRIEVLEAGRLLSVCSDNDFQASYVDDYNPVEEAAKPNRAVAALKRTSSKADLENTISIKKPRISQKMRITSNDGITYEFDADEDGFVHVYTDGACSKNGQYDGKAGVGVWFGKNHPLNISEPVQGRPTNNMAEIQAATWAIQQGIRTGIKKILVVTDSKFVINCITTWIVKWKANGWKTSSGGAVINKEELEVLERVINYPGLNVKWQYVKGHANSVGNIEADFLAKEGAKKYLRGTAVTRNHPWQQYFST